MGDDMVEFRPQESPSEASKGLDIPARYEKVPTRLSGGGRGATRRKGAGHGKGGLIGGRNQHDVPAHDLADRAGKERIMGAAEQQGVDLRVNDWRQKSLREHTDLFRVRLTALNELDETWTRSTRQFHLGRSGRRSALVRPTGHGANRADDAHAVGFRHRQDRSKPWFDNTNNRHRDPSLQFVERYRSGGVEATTISLGS